MTNVYETGKPSSRDNTSPKKSHSSKSLPKILVSQSPSDTSYYYPLEDHVSTDISVLQLKSGMRINICAYLILEHAHIPYVKYLLYKYDHSKHPYSDLLIFPFFLYTKNLDIVDYAINILTDIFSKLSDKTSVKYKGYIQSDDDNIYLFFNFIDEYAKRIDYIWNGKT